MFSFSRGYGGNQPTTNQQRHNNSNSNNNSSRNTASQLLRKQQVTALFSSCFDLFVGGITTSIADIYEFMFNYVYELPTSCPSGQRASQAHSILSECGEVGRRLHPVLYIRMVAEKSPDTIGRFLKERRCVFLVEGN